MSVTDDIGQGESLLATGLIVLLVYLLYKSGILTGITSGVSAVSQGLQQGGLYATTSQADYVGNGKALTAQEARAIAISLGQFPNYTVSPDGMQVWFYDGSYYDNSTGHVFSKDGTDEGTLNDNSGSVLDTVETAGTVAVAATTGL